MPWLLDNSDSRYLVVRQDSLSGNLKDIDAALLVERSKMMSHAYFHTDRYDGIVPSRANNKAAARLCDYKLNAEWDQTCMSSYPIPFKELTPVMMQTFPFRTWQVRLGSYFRFAGSLPTVARRLPLPFLQTHGYWNGNCYASHLPFNIEDSLFYILFQTPLPEATIKQTGKQEPLQPCVLDISLPPCL